MKPTPQSILEISFTSREKEVDEEESGLLLVNLGKIGSNSFGVCRVIFDDNIKNGDFQKVGTTPPIENALVN